MATRADQLTYGSIDVNGQIVPVYQGAALYTGNAVGPTYRGAGQTPPPSIPFGNGGPGSAGAYASAAAAQPFSLTRGPIIALIIMLVVGMLWLRYVHWRA